MEKWVNFEKMGKSGKKVIFENIDFSMFLKFSCKKVQNFSKICLTCGNDSCILLGTPTR